MKLTVQILLALWAIAMIFGVILPWLVSAKSTIAVFLAVLLLGAFVVGAVYTIQRMFK